MGRRASLLLVALAVGLVWAGSAAAAGTDERFTMPDGVEIATTTYDPDGAAPADGWPGVLMLHGLGGKRQDFAALAESYAANGYAVLTYDARGHGESGGVVDVNGPAEIQDLFILFERLRSRANVRDDRIGGWGSPTAAARCCGRRARERRSRPCRCTRRGATSTRRCCRRTWPSRA